MDYVNLGATGVKVSAVGLGTWAWGDWYWNYGSGYGKGDVTGAFNKSLELGVNLIDTADQYGWGLSETMIGELIEGRRDEVFIITKYLPLHLFASSILKAADRSLDRLRTRTIDLYLIHWPSPIMPIPAMMRMMERLVEDGKVRYIGVSNFSLEQLKVAQSSLKHESLVTDEIEYNLLRRAPERNGLLRYLKENKMSLIAYSPLAQGLLTGKYELGSKTAIDVRRLRGTFSEKNLHKTEVLMKTLRMMGARYGKLVSQVSLNWLTHDPTVIPIPGAKTAVQAEQNAGASGWWLSDPDWEVIERSSASLNSL